MYWEEFYELVTIAANADAEEKNADLKFQYMLHADKKSAGKWQDLPIPFPADEEQVARSKGDLGGVSQLPGYLKGAVFKK